MTKPTKGPWTYIRDSDYWRIDPTGIGGKDNYEGNEADYRLAAAAPDLLAACLLIVAARDTGDETAAVEAATAAIAKTKGKRK